MRDDEELPLKTRIDAWFIRGIGFATVSFLAIVLIMIFFVLGDMSSLILPSPLPSEETFPEVLWLLRVYDLLFIVILLFLGAISAACLLNIKALGVPPEKQPQHQRRF